jgi:cyclophilin family peptidyl-prolyl cis-trans isomerase
MGMGVRRRQALDSLHHGPEPHALARPQVEAQGGEDLGLLGLLVQAHLGEEVAGELVHARRVRLGVLDLGEQLLGLLLLGEHLGGDAVAVGQVAAHQGMDELLLDGFVARQPAAQVVEEVLAQPRLGGGALVLLHVLAHLAMASEQQVDDVLAVCLLAAAAQPADDQQGEPGRTGPGYGARGDGAHPRRALVRRLPEIVSPATFRGRPRHHPSSVHSSRMPAGRIPHPDTNTITIGAVASKPPRAPGHVRLPAVASLPSRLAPALLAGAAALLLAACGSSSSSNNSTSAIGIIGGSAQGSSTVPPAAGGALPPATPAATPSPTPCATAHFGSALPPKDAPADVHKYSAPPATQIDAAKLYLATIKTARGSIVLCLQPKLAPNTVNNFVVLARNHFFDGLTFHRVVPQFVIQGGDPSHDGTGGPGYKFADEPVQGDYLPGAVAMANAGPNTNGSQFFICTADDTSLAKKYNLFGAVSAGMDVVLTIQGGDVMQSVTVQESA